MSELNFINKILFQKNNKSVLSKKIEKINEKDNISDDSPAVQSVNNIIKTGIINGASDIHIEPFKDSIIVRYRIDGLLSEFMKLSLNEHEAITIRIKIMADMDIAEKRVPQDGKFEFNLDQKYYDSRVSTVPTIYGEKIVIRILSKSEKILSLDSLGFDENSIN
ncbi:MAG: ATPase, T2SS/T4P/T4SS family, partial [Bacillota bacterium]|nr:ATPase, T2SS/T4P/T4SS family [Bacillota bacterium]